MKKNDFILIAVILIIAITALLGQRFLLGGNPDSPMVVVTIDGVEYGRYPLDEDREERISLEDGSYNVLSISDGEVQMKEASCPDQICVMHRPIHSSNDPIVCLPNRVIVIIENGEDSSIDTITN